MEKFVVVFLLSPIFFFSSFHLFLCWFFFVFYSRECVCVCVWWCAIDQADKLCTSKIIIFPFSYIFVPFFQYRCPFATYRTFVQQPVFQHERCAFVMAVSVWCCCCFCSFDNLRSYCIRLLSFSHFWTGIMDICRTINLRPHPLSDNASWVVKFIWFLVNKKKKYLKKNEWIERRKSSKLNNHRIIVFCRFSYFFFLSLSLIEHRTRSKQRISLYRALNAACDSKQSFWMMIDSRLQSQNDAKKLDDFSIFFINRLFSFFGGVEEPFRWTEITLCIRQ